MWVSIIIFFLSLLAIVCLFGVKHWKLKTGHATSIAEHTDAWTELKIAAVRNEAVEHGRFFTHRFVLLLLKLWIKGSYLIRKYDQMIRSKLTSFLHYNARKMNGDGKDQVSPFLKEISDHKEATKREV